jgi:hypothetical protein
VRWRKVYRSRCRQSNRRGHLKHAAVRKEETKKNDTRAGAVSARRTRRGHTDTHAPGLLGGPPSAAEGLEELDWQARRVVAARGAWRAPCVADTEGCASQRPDTPHVTATPTHALR